MRTLTDATLLTINGPRGAYYAVLDHETGGVLTERTEQAAMALADEKDMLIVDRREISHIQLLTMLASRHPDLERAEADRKLGPTMPTELQNPVQAEPAQSWTTGH